MSSDGGGEATGTFYTMLPLGWATLGFDTKHPDKNGGWKKQ